MTVDQALPSHSPPRVFVAYSWQSMRAVAGELIRELERHGVAVSSADPRLGADWPQAIAVRIANADLMIILITPGDELRKAMQYETRLMLQSCWERPAARITVVAPAVGAIPNALRHQPFVTYYAHDDVGLSRWGSDSSLNNFVLQLLDAQSSPGHEPPQQFSDDEIHEWRNRVVHTGVSALVQSDQQRSQLQQKLLEDLDNFRELASKVEATRTLLEPGRIEQAFDRIILARALGDDELTREYYRIVQRIYNINPPTSPVQEAAFLYGFGLAAAGVGDYSTAREMFTQAVEIDERILGRDHPATISAKYNLGLVYAHLGDDSSAAEAYEAALSSSTEALGASHPQTAEIAYSLGLIHKDRGNVAEARDLFNLAADAYRRVRPDNSPELELVLGQLASIDYNSA